LLTADQPGILLTNVLIHPANDSASVTVYASQEQIAAEQVRIEEQQRVLGIVPNFCVVYGVKYAVSLPAKLTFRIAMRVAVDPVTNADIAILEAHNKLEARQTKRRAPKDTDSGLGPIPRVQHVLSRLQPWNWSCIRELRDWNYRADAQWTDTGVPAPKLTPTAKSSDF